MRPCPILSPESSGVALLFPQRSSPFCPYASAGRTGLQPAVQLLRNRKFDCSNESRPGVSSSLLTPEQAVAKVRQVATAIPQLSVVGIAERATHWRNIAHSFKTLELVREQLPDPGSCVCRRTA